MMMMMMMMIANYGSQVTVDTLTRLVLSESCNEQLLLNTTRRVKTLDEFINDLSVRYRNLKNKVRN